MNQVPGSPASEPLAPPRLRVGADVFVPLGLIALGLIPSVAGISRLLGLAGLASVFPAEARFTADPVPIALHAASATTFLALGAFQFSPRLRARGASFHRRAGYVLIPAGFVAALTGVWMAFVYPFAPNSGVALRYVRLVVGLAMTGSLLLGTRAIFLRDFRSHAAFMTRAYALGVAAGTQALVLFPCMLLGVPETETSYTLVMSAGWVLNVLVAEWVIGRRQRRAEPASVVTARRSMPARSPT